MAFTSDAGARWAGEWINRPMGSKFFSQMVRWSMRSTDQAGKFTVATHLKDNRVHTVVTALDKDDAFLNFLSLTGSAVGPDLKSFSFDLEQIASVATWAILPSTRRGPTSWSSATGCRGGSDPCRRQCSASTEFRDRVANEPLLGRLAETVPKDGKPGKLLDLTPSAEAPKSPQHANPFRHDGLPKPSHSRGVWHWLALLGGCFFFFDVFVRRVQVNFAWAPQLLGRGMAWMTGRQTPVAPVETVERLRSRKAEVASRLRQARVSTRFQPPSDMQPALPSKNLWPSRHRPMEVRPTPPSRRLLKVT